jgi:mannose-6-phosphate isomerase-like protein (cupin superfamily)
MRYLKSLVFLFVMALGLIPALTIRAQQRGETLAWAPIPSTPPGWAAPNKPHWKLTELLASHKGQNAWKETVVADPLLHADYIQLAPGTKTKRQFQPDNPIWWVMQSGTMQFNIEGQLPIMATKGFLVQAPYRNVYNMEVMGDAPALFLEVTVTGSPTMYPIDETPTPAPGMDFVKVRISGKKNYDERNKPFLDFNGMIAAGKNPAGAFVYDDRAFANVIRGPADNDNPKDKGHFHEVSGEFWFVLEGQIEYKITSLQTFVAEQGDVVYVPKGLWHRAHSYGPGRNTRLAMNGYPQMLHNYQPNEELR